MLMMLMVLMVLMVLILMTVTTIETTKRRAEYRRMKSQSMVIGDGILCL
jgi:competence protein ComGC